MGLDWVAHLGPILFFNTRIARIQKANIEKLIKNLAETEKLLKNETKIAKSCIK